MQGKEAEWVKKAYSVFDSISYDVRHWHLSGKIKQWVNMCSHF
jgi:hypothetical protein